MPHKTFAPVPPVSNPPTIVSEPTKAEIPNQPLGTQQSASDTASPSAPQVAALAPTSSVAPARLDYGWLSDTILRRVEELKRYPPEARLDRAEGRVVLKAVIRADGGIDDVEIYQSSGYRSLDQAAVELMKRAAPFQLPRPLGKAKMTVKIPMSYRLEH
jgi:periplasmic protein TonB